MFVALSLSLALAAAPGCVQLEVAATGRNAHGSAIMPAAAPHLLIKALDRLPDWVAGSPKIQGARITALQAAPVVNIIPRRAVAIVDVSFAEGALDGDALVAELVEALGPRIEIQLLATSCRPSP